MRRRINPDGIRLIKYFEGFRPTAYQDSVGVWTIGFGSTTGVQPGMKLTEPEAEERLKADLETAEKAVERLVTAPLNENQFAALVSLCFNIGQGNFEKSTLLKLLNQRKYESAAIAFLDWCKAGGKTVKGLLGRRQAEKRLFEEVI